MRKMHYEINIQASPEAVWNAIVDDKKFMEWTENGGVSILPRFVDPFFECVAVPLFIAHRYYREKNHKDAIRAATLCMAGDWRLATIEWIERRERKAREAAKRG